MYRRMKKMVFSFVFSLFVCFSSYCQDLPVNPSTGKVTFMEVLDAKNMKADDLYKVLSEWCTAQGFKLSKDDKSNGEATFTGSLPVEYGSTKPGRTDKGKVNFNYSFFCKDGKYRYIVTDFVHEGLEGAAAGGKLENVQPECGKAGMVPVSWVQIKNKTKSQMEFWVNEMKKAEIQVQNDPAKNKDW
jgi:hypothetical protein